MTRCLASSFYRSCTCVGEENRLKLNRVTTGKSVEVTLTCFLMEAMFVLSNGNDEMEFKMEMQMIK